MKLHISLVTLHTSLQVIQSPKRIQRYANIINTTKKCSMHILHKDSKNHCKEQNHEKGKKEKPIIHKLHTLQKKRNLEKLNHVLHMKKSKTNEYDKKQGTDR